MALVLAATSLGGCTDLRRALGLEKAPPDEFSVIEGSPLTLPPDYGLRPPRTPSDKPPGIGAAESARSAVFRLADNGKPADAKPDNGLSPGEQALLTKAGAGAATSAIRVQVDKDNAQASKTDQSWTDSLLFWKSDAPPPPVTVDAIGESKRLSENAAQGKPPTAGETPKIERDSHTLLDGLF